MGPKEKYTVEELHPIRHMEDYKAEIAAGQVSPYRTNQLKNRFAKVKKIAESMYKDAYFLIMKIDNEMMQDAVFLWKHDLESVKMFSIDLKCSYGEYSDENLHPIRHFEAYVEEIETKNLSAERTIQLKERLGLVLRLAVHLYFDAECLIRQLD